MKKIISLIAFIAMLAVPVFAQTSANVRVNSLNALVQLPILSTNMSAMVSGNATIGDGGYAGDFTYDSTSSAATNTYSVFKPAATTGRWVRRNEAAWNQFTAATAADASTYAFSMRRNLQTNVFNLGADNNNVYLQSQASYALHLNNIGNNTILNATAGSVGVGNSSPLVKLDVTGAIRSQDFAGASAGSGLEIGYQPATSRGVIIPFNRSGGAYLGMDYAALTHDFYAGATIAASISSTGNLGIGVTNAASLLEVRGGLTTAGSILTLGTKEPTVVANDVLGRINFYAPLDVAGTDANLVAGSIATVAEGTFSATSNASSLIFQTGNSETATTKMTITSGGNVTVTGIVSGTGGLSVGGGATIVSMLSATAVLDFASIPANTSADLTITVTGAAANDIAMAGPPTTQTSGIVISAFVSAANTVTIRAANVTVGAIDPASATYRASVIRY